MVEAILAITLALTTAAVLVFFAYKEREHTRYQENLHIIITGLPDKLHQEIATKLAERDRERDKLLERTFAQYLKHIQALEKAALPKTAPRPANLQDEIAQVLAQQAMPVENEIEKQPEDGSIKLNDSNFRGIPFSGETKIEIEGEEIPTDVF